MTLGETLGALAHLPDDAQITVTVRKGDLARALEQRAGGPEVLSTRQAAGLLGYEPHRWQRWAAAGRIAGAWQDEQSGHWHLPRAACEAHLRSLQQQAARSAGDAAPPSPARSSSRPRSLPRGPRSRRSTALSAVSHTPGHAASRAPAAAVVPFAARTRRADTGAAARPSAP